MNDPDAKVRKKVQNTFKMGAAVTLYYYFGVAYEGLAVFIHAFFYVESGILQTVGHEMYPHTINLCVYALIVWFIGTTPREAWHMLTKDR